LQASEAADKRRRWLKYGKLCRYMWCSSYNSNVRSTQNKQNRTRLLILKYSGAKWRAMRPTPTPRVNAAAAAAAASSGCDGITSVSDDAAETFIPMTRRLCTRFPIHATVFNFVAMAHATELKKIGSSLKTQKSYRFQRILVSGFVHQGRAMTVK